MVLPPHLASGRGLLVQTGDGLLAIELAQRPGRRAVSGRDLLNGMRGLAGSILGT